jgi:RNA polymerase sigma-70 factor, ECF subfamily
LALSITRCPADAEDAVQAAFARLCRNGQPAARDPVALTFAAVRNAALDLLRRRRPHSPPQASLAACLLQAGGSPEGALSAGERDQAIAAAVDALPEDLRTVVLLRVFSGLTFRQVGELTDSPLPTVVSRYRAALSRLGPQLRKWL